MGASQGDTSFDGEKNIHPMLAKHIKHQIAEKNAKLKAEEDARRKQEEEERKKASIVDDFKSVHPKIRKKLLAERAAKEKEERRKIREKERLEKEARDAIEAAK